MVILFYFNFYCYYITCPNFSPFALLHLAHLTLLQSIPTPLSMSMGHSYMFFDQQSLLLISTIIPLPHPLWLLSVCSMFPYHWFQQFILNISPFQVLSFFSTFLKLLFNYSCLHFLPTHPPHPSQTHLPPPLPPSPLVLLKINL